MQVERLPKHEVNSLIHAMHTMIFKTSTFPASTYIRILLNSSLSKFLGSKNNLLRRAQSLLDSRFRDQSDSYFKDFGFFNRDLISLAGALLYLFF